MIAARATNRNAVRTSVTGMNSSMVHAPVIRNSRPWEPRRLPGGEEEVACRQVSRADADGKGSGGCQHPPRLQRTQCALAQAPAGPGRWSAPDAVDDETRQKHAGHFSGRHKHDAAKLAGGERGATHASALHRAARRRAWRVSGEEEEKGEPCTQTGAVVAPFGSGHDTPSSPRRLPQQ